VTPSATPVTALRAAAYEIPTDRPESDGTLAWDSTVLVVVEADAGGATGLGYTYAHQSAVPLVTAKLADLVVGRDLHDNRAAWKVMVDALRNIGAVGLGAMAVSAVDAALWDLKARLLDQPLVGLLGATYETVPVYGSGGFTSYPDDVLAEQLSGWVEQGIPRVKLKTGRDPAGDRDRLHVARKAVGDATDLYTDANGAFSPRSAIEWAGVYRGEFGVSWFEEPVSSDDLAGLRLVRESAPGGIDITAGEYCWAPWSCAAMLDAQAVDCLQVDVTRCLGITGFLAGAALAEAHGIDVSAHCAPQLSAHVCAAVRRLRHLEYFHDHVRIESMLFDGVLVPEPGGELRPDRSRPGHGLTFKTADAARFRVA
jgi:L-alanine-DL-glutamate epimerase-like enolase superfamily enzyme